MIPFGDADLTTLDAVRRQLHGADAAPNANDDLDLVEAIAHASDLITGGCGRGFVPYRQVRTFDARGQHITARRLDLPDCLEVRAVTNGDGAAVTSAHYRLIPANDYPKYGIELLPSSGITWTYRTDWQDAIAIDAWWGFHLDYGRAWVDTLDTVRNSGGLAAEATVIDVVDADGLNARNHARFQVGLWLRVEDELVKVITVNTELNQVTVLRGQLGTEAATHALDAPIRSYQPMMDVERGVRSLAIWLYRTQAEAGKRLVFLGQDWFLADDVPAPAKGVLQKYGKVRMG